MSNLKKNDQDEYTILNIPYAQYIKGDLDFAKISLSITVTPLHFILGEVLPFLTETHG